MKKNNGDNVKAQKKSVKDAGQSVYQYYHCIVHTSSGMGLEMTSEHETVTQRNERKTNLNTYISTKEATAASHLAVSNREQTLYTFVCPFLNWLLDLMHYRITHRHHCHHDHHHHYTNFKWGKINLFCLSLSFPLTQLLHHHTYIQSTSSSYTIPPILFITYFSCIRVLRSVHCRLQYSLVYIFISFHFHRSTFCNVRTLLKWRKKRTTQSLWVKQKKQSGGPC